MSFLQYAKKPTDATALSELREKYKQVSKRSHQRRLALKQLQRAYESLLHKSKATEAREQVLVGKLARVEVERDQLAAALKDYENPVGRIMRERNAEYQTQFALAGRGGH